MELAIALITLAAMEIVLGIDNIVYLAILTAKLPEHQQSKARRLGLFLALGMRILLLCGIAWVMHLTHPLFHVSKVAESVGIPAAWVQLEDPNHPAPHPVEHPKQEGEASAEPPVDTADGISIKDLILIVGGMVLLYNSVREIHHKVTGHEEGESHVAPRVASFSGVLAQIVMFDLIFSLDSVITAVGMARDIRVMIAAVVIAMIVMMLFADRLSRFVEHNPTITMLALSFLILIGMLLVAEGLGQHFNKGYIYFAMAFSLVVEFLNLRMKANAKRRAGPDKAAGI